MDLVRVETQSAPVAPPVAFDQAAGIAPEAAPAQSAQPGPPQRLIRNGDAWLEVRSVSVAIDSLRLRTESLGGFVARSEIYEGGEGSRSGAIGVRVPAEGFDAFVEALGGLGRVRSSSSSVTDVSQQYFDVETRLAVQEQTLARLEALLDRSGSLSDVLAVERELARVTADLESLKGNLRFYDERIAYSELNIRLTEPDAALSPGAFRPVGDALRGSLRAFAGSLAALIHFLAVLLPWLVPVLLLGWLLRGVLRRVRGRRRPGGGGVGPTTLPG